MFAQNRYQWLAVVTGLLLAACATGTAVRSQIAQNANLAAYRTYAFVARPGTDKEGYKTLTTQDIERAVSREMQARGYALAPDGQADLLINFNVKEQDIVEGDLEPGDDDWYNSGDYYKSITIVTERSLMIDLVDRARNEVVWSGTAVGELTKKMLDNPGPAIDQSVADIFARYPIKVN
jgi:Domain of unknown function (DUF4136)